MINIRKYVLTLWALVFLAATVSGQSQLSVNPDTVEDNVSVGHPHRFQFTIENTASNRTLNNITLGDTEFLNWSSNKFSLNGSESKPVNATFYTERDGQFNASLPTTYTVDGTQSQGPNISTVIDAFYLDTNISLKIFETDFELQFGEQDSSVFRVTNTGNETAYNVTLNGGNVSFDQSSGVNLDPGEDILVEYTVEIPKPEENPTNASNQSYNVPVTISGENFQNHSFNASVFIEYKQYNETEQAKSIAEEWLEIERQRLEYCRSVDFEAPICEGNGFVVRENVTETEYRTPASNYTLTNNTVAALQEIPGLVRSQNDTLEDVLRRTNLLEARFDRELDEAEKNISSNLSRVTSQVENNSEKMKEINRTVVSYIRSEEREESNQTTVNIILALGVVLVALLSRADKIKEIWHHKFGHNGW